MYFLNKLKSFNVRRYKKMSTLIRMVTYTSKDLPYHNYSESGTLVGRFGRYLASKNFKNEGPSLLQNSFSKLKVNRDVLTQISNDQLMDLVANIDLYMSMVTEQNLTQLINDLDKECLKRLKQFNSIETLRLLYGFSFVLHGEISRLSFYRNAIEILVENFKNNQSADNYVQICFFLGMWKKNRCTDALMTKLHTEHFINYLNDISTTEFCIVCTAFYKMSIRITSEAFSKRLENDIVTMNTPIDQIFLVTFVKTCKMNSIKSVEIKKRIKELLLTSQLDSFRFNLMVHLFAYFAQNLFYDEEACQKFVRKCVEMVKVDYKGNNQKDMRGKDFGTFLWSCGQLNLNFLSESDFQLFENRILDKIARGEYKYKFIDLIDSCLSLWVLNYKSEKLIHHVFNNKKIRHPEIDYRANLLKSCVQIEQPEFLKHHTIPVYDSQRSSPKYMRDQCPNLNKIFKILRRIGDNFGIRRNHIVSPINYFYAPGIRLEYENGNEIYLEILESRHLLDDDKTPTGMFSLKTRLLQRCGCNVIQVNLSDRTDDELAEYLKTLLLPSTIDKRRSK